MITSAAHGCTVRRRSEMPCFSHAEMIGSLGSLEQGRAERRVIRRLRRLARHALPARRLGDSRLCARETLIAAAAALAFALVLVAFLPLPDDAAAHYYRTLLLSRGIVVWDNLWYGGQYPLASYGVLFYLPALLLGTVVTGVISVVVSAGMFASVIVTQWGRQAIWPARSFAVFCLGPLLTGTYAYALGLALMLGALRAVQARRPWSSLVLAALTLLASPLAFVFLCLVLGAVASVRRRGGYCVRVVAGGTAALALAELALLLQFGSPGFYPFLIWNLLGVLAVSLLGLRLSRAESRDDGSLLAALFAVWALTCVLGFAVRTPLGDNLDRLRYLAFPLVLLAAARAPRSARLLGAVSVVAAFGYAAAPDLASAFSRDGAQTSGRAFWAPALQFLKRHAEPTYRVEVVQTRARWEAYWLPNAGFALARGWYRQLDMAENPVLYRHSITPQSYRTWLRRMSVRYVLLPHAQLDSAGASSEARLLASGRSGLAPVAVIATGVIYEVARPAALLTGRDPARVTAFSNDRVAGLVAAPGVYELRVRYMPFWSRAGGAVCVTRARDGMTEIRASRKGRFALDVPDELVPLVSSIVSGGNARC